MIPIDRINYTTVRDHASKEASFRCTASLPAVVPDGAAPVVVSAEAMAATKDEAQDAAQLALLKKLIAKPAAAVPPAAPKLKEMP